MAGPFYWAWVDDDETVFTTDHVREDETVFGFVVTHAEGQFAALSLELENPRIGLLAPSRKVWGWLSWDNGSEIVPLFFGRLIGIPSDIHMEVVTLEFTARPKDYENQKVYLAEEMRDLPFYDPVFIAEEQRDDPDVVLEARAELWHIDRVTHELTSSNILVGEDGNEDFIDSEVPYESVSTTLNQPPLRAVEVIGEVNWIQGGHGQITDTQNVVSMTGGGLMRGWPQIGTSLGGGWKVESASSTDRGSTDSITAEDYGTSRWPPGAILIKVKDWHFSGAYQVEGVAILPYKILGKMTMSYDVERQYAEQVRFTLQSNLQPIVTLPDESQVLKLEINGSDVSVPIDDVIPIGDVTRRQYFTTDRGNESVAYLIALARSHLLVRSRAVEVEFACRFERAVNLTLRKNARLFDHRLPGGNALGKIIEYSFSSNGDSGELIGNVKIGCAIGYGGAVTEIAGEPTYIDDDYIEDDYQEHTGGLEVLGPGDVGYSLPSGPPNDDSVVLTNGIKKHDALSSGMTI